MVAESQGHSSKGTRSHRPLVVALVISSGTLPGSIVSWHNWLTDYRAKASSNSRQNPSRAEDRGTHQTDGQRLQMEPKPGRLPLLLQGTHFPYLTKPDILAQKTLTSVFYQFFRLTTRAPQFLRGDTYFMRTGLSHSLLREPLLPKPMMPCEWSQTSPNGHGEGSTFTVHFVRSGSPWEQTSASVC